MALKNLPSRKNTFMKSFLKIGMKKMSLNTKQKTLNELKNVPRSYTFLILLLNKNIT